LIMSEIAVKLITLGCPKNIVDSEIIKSIFKGKKFRVTGDNDNAELVIINTCGFIEEAKRESVDMILNAVQLKNEKKIDKIVVTGCLSQRYKKELSEEIPEIDYIFGVHEFNKIYETFHNTPCSTSKLNRALITPNHYAYLKIAEGCDNRCSYCAIPSIRGSFKSRRINSLLEETRFLARQGVKEIILIAEDITSYGIDIYGKRRLPHLIEKIAAIEGIEWVRILYTYPRYVNDDLLEILSDNEKVCNYIDIPIQHVSDNVLKLMGRKYTHDFLCRLIEKIRTNVPRIALRTSVIAGFPGETKKDFNLLADFIGTTRFDRLGVFTYSREEGTPAYSYKKQISRKEKEERAEELRSIQRDIAREKNNNLKGKKIKVLVDSYNEECGASMGRTEKDAPEIDNIVYVRKKINPGEFVVTTITDVSDFELYGI